MNKIYLMVAASFLLLCACQREMIESPGNIPGMGETPGELEVVSNYVLPDGIDLVGDITGIDEAAMSEIASVANVKSASALSSYGSGGKYVRIQLTLQNRTERDVTVYFPQGLVWRCEQQGYQHAITAQTTWVCLRQNSRRTIFLDLYCINFGRHGSSIESNYAMVGVSNSVTIGRLMKLIGWKKINFEMLCSSTDGELKAANETELSYAEVTDRVQTIIWNLTNHGLDLSADDEAFFAGLPDIEEAQRPVTDKDGNFAGYLEEYSVVSE